MRSKCIDSTSGRKSVTGNGFSDIGLQQDVKIFATRRFFSYSLAIYEISLDHITTSSLESDVIFEFSAAIFLQNAVISGAQHCFRRLW